MYAQDLLDFAVLSALDAEAILQNRVCIEEKRLEQYWLASRRRFDRWTVAMRRWGEGRVHLGEKRLADAVETQVEEMIASEILTRVWAALTVLKVPDEQEPTVRSVMQPLLLRYVDARNRMMELLLEASVGSERLCRRFLQLQKAAVHWGDFLLAMIGHEEKTSDFAYHKKQRPELSTVRYWAQESPKVRTAFLRVLHREFDFSVDRATENGPWNARVVTIILDGFSPQSYEMSSLQHRLFFSKVLAYTDSASCLLTELLERR